MLPHKFSVQNDCGGNESLWNPTGADDQDGHVYAEESDGLREEVFSLQTMKMLDVA